MKPDEQVAPFGSLEALVLPLLQQLMGGQAGGMSVQAPPQQPQSFFPRGDVPALRGMLEGDDDRPGRASVPHFKQALGKSKTSPNTDPRLQPNNP